MSYSPYSDQQSNYLEVHEFSRGFIDVSEINGRWVSGGYGDEVGKSNHPVPEQIKAAVNQRDFRINDNYPPKENEYALIGREIDNKYSVLAVATLAGDDKVRRMIAYRYFWLEKPVSQDIDGVGTLLIWWINNEEPKFDFQWEPNHRTLNYITRYYSREESYKYFEQYKSYVQNIINKINYYPFVFQMTDANLPNGLHYLALYLNKNYGTPIAWAWNVPWLEKPQGLTLICCSDGISYKNNSKYIQKHKRILSNVNTYSNTHQPPSPQPNTPNFVGAVSETVAQSRIDSQPTRTGNNQVWNKIRQCLLSIPRNPVSYSNSQLQELATYIEQYPIKDWNWDSIIDISMMNNSNQPAGTKYRALLVILGYISVPAWLDTMRNRNRESLEIQGQLVEFCRQHHHLKALKQLEDNIYVGILELLFQYKSLKNNYSSLQKCEQIKWLLKDSNSFWANYFNVFMDVISDIAPSSSIQRPIEPQRGPVVQQNRTHSRWGLPKIELGRILKSQWFEYLSYVTLLSIMTGILFFLAPREKNDGPQHASNPEVISNNCLESIQNYGALKNLIEEKNKKQSDINNDNDYQCLVQYVPEKPEINNQNETTIESELLDILEINTIDDFNNEYKGRHELKTSTTGTSYVSNNLENLIQEVQNEQVKKAAELLSSAKQKNRLNNAIEQLDKCKNESENYIECLKSKIENPQ